MDATSRNRWGEEPSEPIRVLLVDDEERIRRALTRTLGASQGIRVVGTAADGVEALNAAERWNPDVVLMDVKMPRMDGIEATRKLLERQPWIKVLAMSGFSDEELVDGMLEAGAVGYLDKLSPSEEIVAAIRHVAQGGCYLGPEASAVLVAEKREGARPETAQAKEEDAPRSNLSPREREVLRLVAEGKETKEIAVELGVSVWSVYRTRQGLLEKLGLGSTVELVRYAVRNGMFKP
ncbi:MAG: response regulator transcription factor [Deltaproteobacteria bacterium]|nr:response regulator transcription factor [Deltaproteobacteria bacterium]